MDLYDLLGVPRRATPAQIRRAFQKRARQWHPDINPGDPRAAERYASLQRALEVLADAERRALYDRGGNPWPPAAAQGPQVGFAGFDFSVELRSQESGSFREIFGGMLPGSAPRPEAAPGEDLEESTRISFDEAFQGTRRRVQLVRQDQCPACEGRGDVSFAPQVCPKCAGSGHVRTRRGHLAFTHDCPECAGTGRLDRRPCAECGAEGRVMHSEWLDVQIPAGVESGSRVRLSGCGNAGRRGGPAGDFVLRVEVEPHALFQRDGADLRCRVPITMMEAALGGHVEVPTPDGPVNIEIPAATQTGQRFRLRKRGLPRLGAAGRGDLWVEVEVWIPRLLGERARELVRELQRLQPECPRENGGRPETGA